MTDEEASSARRARLSRKAAKLKLVAVGGGRRSDDRFPPVASLGRLGIKLGIIRDFIARNADRSGQTGHSDTVLRALK